MERILATTGLSILALLAMFFVPLKISLLVTGFALLAAASIFLLLMILFPAFLSIMQKALGRFAALVKFFNGFQEHGIRMRNHVFVLAHALLWSVVFQFCVVLVNYCIFRALAINQVSLLYACLFIPATSVAAMLPVGINGYGTREGAYVALFAYAGVSRAEAITASVLFALLVSMTSIWGGWVWLRKNHGTRGSDEGEGVNPGEGGKILCRGL